MSHGVSNEMSGEKYSSYLNNFVCNLNRLEAVALSHFKLSVVVLELFACTQNFSGCIDVDDAQPYTS